MGRLRQAPRRNDHGVPTRSRRGPARGQRPRRRRSTIASGGAWATGKRRTPTGEGVFVAAGGGGADWHPGTMTSHARYPARAWIGETVGVTGRTVSGSGPGSIGDAFESSSPSDSCAAGSGRHGGTVRNELSGESGGSRRVTG